MTTFCHIVIITVIGSHLQFVFRLRNTEEHKMEIATSNPAICSLLLAIQLASS